MNERRRIRILSIAFLLLVALNLATLSAFFIFKKQGPPAGPKSGAAEFLIRQLGLDSSQQQQLGELIKAHRSQVRGLREQTRESKDAFFELLKEPSVNDAALSAAAARASLPDQQVDMYTFRHFQKVRALCNEEQKRKFDAIIHEVLRMNAPPGPPPGMGPAGLLRGKGMNIGRLVNSNK